MCVVTKQTSQGLALAVDAQVRFRVIQEMMAMEPGVG